jgi:hypothetical protein
MRTRTFSRIAVLAVALSVAASAVESKGDDFNSVVKLIEQFYGVKHEGIPFLARAGMKVVGTAAKVKGGDIKRLAELGSVKVAMFEDQEFRGDFMKFRVMINDALAETWTPLIQTFSTTDNEQTYIFVRSSGDKFNVLIVTIEANEGTVVQATVSAKNMAQLLKDPENAGKTITQEATIIDQE